MAQPAPQKHHEPPLAQRLLWFVALWGAGVLVVAAVAYLIKLMIEP